MSRSTRLTFLDKLIAEIIGHGDASTTRKVYTHIFDRDQQNEKVRMALEGMAS